MPDTCRSCGKPILWVKTAATGSLMPLDLPPCDGGNVAIDSDGKAHVSKGGLFEYVGDGPRYRSHFVTCPNAARHRKRR